MSDLLFCCIHCCRFKSKPILFSIWLKCQSFHSKSN
uniref:Uncharacterized protein n=1 Tax=Rhizophora mucronata TaxID=61149 RepID=A0A2P2QZH8_RHIMU